MKSRTWTEVQYGVQYDEDPRYDKGYVETGGINPGGAVVPRFSKEECEYMAKGKGRKVVRRVIIHSETTYDWE